MPAPSTSLSVLRPDLAGALEEFNLAADRAGFIGHRVLPVIDTAAQAGQFGKIPIEQLLQNRETSRTSRGGYNRADWQFTYDTFATSENGWEEPIDDREKNMYREMIDAELVATGRAFDFVLRAAERRVAALVYNATTFASYTGGVTNEWDDATNATPIADVESAVQTVWGNTGLWPNCLIVNRKVFRNLRLCADIQDQITASGAGSPAKASDITTAMLSAVFDLPYILVAGGAQNTANVGLDASISSIWSDEYAMVCRIGETNDVREPCLGRTFHWPGDGSSVDGRVETYRDETVRADIVRVRHETQEKLLYVQCGYLLSNITT